MKILLSSSEILWKKLLILLVLTDENLNLIYTYLFSFFAVGFVYFFILFVLENLNDEICIK